MKAYKEGMQQAQQQMVLYRQLGVDEDAFKQWVLNCSRNNC